MSLQIESGVTHTLGNNNAVNFPRSELMQMFEDARLAIEVEPERTAAIALEFVSRIASGSSRSTDARGGLAP